MVCYFRPIPLRILNIGNATTGEFYDNAIPALGDYTFSDGHLELTYDFTILDIHDYWRWTYPNDSSTFSYVLNATNPSQGNALKLTLTSNKSPLIVGGDGWVGIGDGADSSYYGPTVGTFLRKPRKRLRMVQHPGGQYWCNTR